MKPGAYCATEIQRSIYKRRKKLKISNAIWNKNDYESNIPNTIEFSQKIKIGIIF